MSAGRLDAPCGARIDRSRPMNFRFNGKPYLGFAGDTLASALLANGVRIVGRSYKLHRPRGILSCGIEEPCAIVDVGEGARRTPNVRATGLALRDGMVAESVNCWPSVDFDMGALSSVAGALLPAGFYYKTFKWPGWRLFEPAIRHMAGLGRLPAGRDPDRYDEVAAAVDVLVAGGGLAGMAAAVSAAESGANVWLVTPGIRLGGALEGRNDEGRWSSYCKAVQNLGIRVLTRASVFGIYDHNLACARQYLDGPESGDAPVQQRLWKIRARTVISACGAFERPMVFPDNDRPGVMLLTAVERYARLYGVLCGKRAVVACNSDAAYVLSQSLSERGLEIAAIVDRRPPEMIGDEWLSSVRTQVIADAAIRSVRGRRAVRGCEVIRERNGNAGQVFDCDLVISAGGFAPAVHLHSQAGGRLRWEDQSSMFVPEGTAPGVVSVGACAGVFLSSAAVAHAHELGRAVALGRSLPPVPIGGAGRSLRDVRFVGVRGRQFVDIQNDVTTDDIAKAARENYRSVEHLKRYTTIGMGTDQGKTSNTNALVILGEETGRAPAQVGTTKFRPPFAPVTLGLLAGNRVGSLLRPTKRLRMHEWHVRQRAVFEEYGAWLRPSAYPYLGEPVEEAAAREARAVRQSVGLFDASPLGKLEVFGPDAGRFLDHMYLQTISTLPMGHARYGLLLNENGVVVDDGVVTRLDENRFWVNTSSAGAERTAAAFEEWLQCEFVDLKVLVTPVTARWTNITVAGPRAWECLRTAGMDAALAPEAMKHMELRDVTLDGVSLRVLRISFTGELSYEINVPAHHGPVFLDRLWQAALEYEATPFGVEALQILRIEKGYIHVGSDTDGTTLPGDIGFGSAYARKPEDFVGRRSLQRAAARDANRLQLIALQPVDKRTPISVGAQIAPSPPPGLTQGHVTSSAVSPTLGHPIALAMLAGGRSRIGERVWVHHLGRSLEAAVVRAPFVDPRGSRLHG